jgi:hypothetical protein
MLVKGPFSANWLPFVNSFRTLCHTPMPEIKAVFDSLQQLILTG